MHKSADNLKSIFVCGTVAQIGPRQPCFLRFLDHMELDTHNKHKRQTSTPSVGFEPVIPAIRSLQTYTLDRTATRMDRKYY
jgi:hypothetical protein